MLARELAHEDAWRGVIPFVRSRTLPRFPEYFLDNLFSFGFVPHDLHHDRMDLIAEAIEQSAECRQVAVGEARDEELVLKTVGAEGVGNTDD